MRAGLLAVPLLLVAWAGYGDEVADSPPRPAAQAPLAAQALLNDVARAGTRWVAVGGWGNIVLSDDEGVSWRQASAVPARRTLASVYFADAEHGWAVGHDALVLHSADGGEHWEIQYRDLDADAPLLSVWFRDAQRGLAVGGFGQLVETRDGGRSWQGRRLGPEGEEPHLNHVFPGPDGMLFIAAEFGAAFRSRDDGATWEALRLPYEGSLWYGLSLPSTRRVLMFGMRGHVFRSEDLGESWLPVETGSDQSLQAATRLRDGRVVAVGLGGTVLTSRDGGLRFEPSVRSDRSGLAAVAEASDGELLLFGEKGTRRGLAAERAPAAGP
ncbi:MAG: WD40/YVTN/BNR-like repeat-containing protein [Myxococcota bacterium]